jgi:predicted DNA-binding transcriptional regulator YafY
VRTVEPHRLACAGRRWYLLGWDVDRADWRTFRVERIRLRESRGPRFAPRALPDGDVAAFIAAGIAPRGRDRRAVVVLPMSAEEAAAAHIADRDEAVEAMDATACRATVTARSTQGLALRLAGLGVDFDVVEAPPELAVCLGELGRRLVRAAAG